MKDELRVRALDGWTRKGLVLKLKQKKINDIYTSASLDKPNSHQLELGRFNSEPEFQLVLGLFLLMNDPKRSFTPAESQADPEL